MSTILIFWCSERHLFLFVRRQISSPFWHSTSYLNKKSVRLFLSFHWFPLTICLVFVRKIGAHFQNKDLQELTIPANSVLLVLLISRHFCVHATYKCKFALELGCTAAASKVLRVLCGEHNCLLGEPPARQFASRHYDLLSELISPFHLFISISNNIQ